MPHSRSVPTASSYIRRRRFGNIAVCGTMSLVPRTLQGAPELSAAERGALAVLAEHARASARLGCVWLFTHPLQTRLRGRPRPGCPRLRRGSEPLAEAAARAAVARTARGDRRRFDRTRNAETAGTRVATAVGATSAVSAAGQPGSAGWSAKAEAALTDLAQVALRLTSEPAPLPIGGPRARVAPPGGREGAVRTGRRARPALRHGPGHGPGAARGAADPGGVPGPGPAQRCPSRTGRWPTRSRRSRPTSAWRSP